jgi:hypothetical protein
MRNYNELRKMMKEYRIKNKYMEKKRKIIIDIKKSKMKKFK